MTKTASKTNANAEMAKHIGLALSDTYVLAVKTHGYHWNVTGPFFAPLHAFFGTQYEALFAAADELAERMRALDVMPEGSMKAFLQSTVVKEADTKELTSEEMLKDLMHSHEKLRERLAVAVDFAGDVDDMASQDLLIQRLQDHDKSIWMIRSHLA